ncbi:MAG TPA: tetratricopeptide repeat protein [Chloroflexia bacterium]|jgi:predicted ATPase/transcriptional regulator with XRE-family HTH domain
MNDVASFGRWLRQRRQSLELSREDLAEIVGCARVTIAKIEQDERRPSRQVAERLAEALKLPADERDGFILWARGVAEEVAPSLPFQPASPHPAIQPGLPISPSAPTPREAPHQQLSTPPDTMPASTTSFIGRAREVAKVRSLLWRADVRLLTLTGPPGIGKTRLGMAVAASVRQDFEHGVCFVALSSLNDASLVAPTIAQTLGLKEVSGQAVEVTLQTYLRDKQMLMLLDNFEQVIQAAPLVSNLMSGAPGLKLMVTSRAVLHVYGEHEFVVPPLDLPYPKKLPAVDELSQCEAVALFTQRAQAVQPGFALTRENAQVVAQICVRLDGLPLALELAAARTKLFTPHSMLARLNQRLSLLTGGPRDLPARQQTLRGAISWSYDLLSEDEQTLFRRLSVFVAGCTLEAAETVCEFGISDFELRNENERETNSKFEIRNSKSIGVLDGLASLMDKSLLRQEDASGGEPRFVMLETLREYGLAQLAERDELDIMQRHYAAYYLALAERAEPELRGPEQGVWLARLEQEHDNLRAVFRWALDAGEQEIALRLGGALGRFWYTRSYLVEGQQWLDAALSESEDAAPAIRAKALGSAGSLALLQNEHTRARVLMDESLRLWQVVGDPASIARGMSNLGAAIAIQGDFSHATSLFEQSMEIWREVGDDWNRALSLANMGFAMLCQGDYERSGALCAESLAIRRVLGDTSGITLSLINLGLVPLHQGDYRRAIELFKESIELARELGDRRNVALAYTYLGLSALRLGEYEQASHYYQESLTLSREIMHKFGVARTFLGMAGIAFEGGQVERAVSLCGAADAQYDNLNVSLTPAERALHEKTLDAAKSRLDGATFAKAWEAGQALSLDEAVNYARGQGPGIRGQRE